ncbi:unnamed protein product [Schistosoma turkestanicum]|nr:unnamed protein product [Schistosoma turkestanicum]
MGDYTVNLKRNSHEAIYLMEKKVENGFSAEETRISTLLDRFHSRLGSKPNDDISHKVNQLALRLSEANCPSSSIHNIKNRSLAAKEYQNDLEISVASLENSYNSLKAIISEVDDMERNLIRFSNDWCLSQESILSDMRSMQHIKEKYSSLSKSLSDSDRQLSIPTSIKTTAAYRTFLLKMWLYQTTHIRDMV